MTSLERATVHARTTRAQEAAHLARLRRELRGDARTRLARSLRGLATRVEPRAPRRPGRVTALDRAA